MTTYDEVMISLGLEPSASTPERRCPTGCRGNRTAYQRHVRLGEEPCDKSREANAAYKRGKTGAAPRQPAGCGSYSGYQMHVKLGEIVCDRCAEARRRRDREYYAARKQAA